MQSAAARKSGIAVDIRVATYGHVFSASDGYAAKMVNHNDVDQVGVGNSVAFELPKVAQFSNFLHAHGFKQIVRKKHM